MLKKTENGRLYDTNPRTDKTIRKTEQGRMYIVPKKAPPAAPKAKPTTKRKK